MDEDLGQPGDGGNDPMLWSGAADARTLGEQIDGATPEAAADDSARWDAFVGKMTLPSQPIVDAPTAPVGSNRRRRVVIGAAVVLIASAATAGIVSFAGGPGVPGAGQAPAAFVFSSTQSTLNHRTADVIFDGAVNAAGHTLPLQGTGQADFTTGSFSGNFSVNASALSLVEHELVVGGHFYLGLVEDGTDIATLTSGRHWVEIPIPTGTGTASVGLGSVDPITQLQVIEKKGAAVAPLGTSVINGVTTSGFSITPSKQEIEQNIQKEGAAGLPPSVAQQAQKLAQSLSTFTFDVWFDGSGLLRRETVDLGTSGANSFSGRVNETFENYGAAVNLSPPSSSDVISYQDFVTALQSAGAQPS